MKLRFNNVLAAVLLTAAPACLAASSPWDGTWKLNEAKSKLTGDTFTITAKPDGFHYSSGGIENYDFACDGKSYPVLADRAVSCTGDASAGYDFAYAAGSFVLSKAHHSLSPDGKTLHIQGTATHPDGSTSTFDETYKRVSGAAGLEGAWKNVKEKSTASNTMILAVQGSTMHVEDPLNKISYDARLDGTQAPVVGPTIPDGAMTSVTLESPTKLHYKDVYKGKTLWEGTQSLSSDGKVLTDVEWEAGKPTEAMTAVYEKQ